MTRAALVGFIGAALLAGCAANPAPDLQSSVQATQASRAELLAEALTDAQAAEQRADAAALGDALRRLDALGAKALDDQAHSDLVRWSALATPGGPPLRGRALGPGFRSGQLAPSASRVFEQTFLAGKRASIVASVKGTRPIALEVMAGDKEPLCQRRAPRSTCAWTPLYTQRYSIRLTNPDSEKRRYYLVID